MFLYYDVSQSTMALKFKQFIFPYNITLIHRWLV